MFPQVRFWTMRVATEIGEKRVAHSQAKEQEGMVPLKVDNEADHWNQDHNNHYHDYHSLSSNIWPYCLSDQKKSLF